MIPPFHLWDNPADPVTEGPAQWLSPSLLALEGFPISGGADCYKVIPWHHLQRPVWRLRVYHNHFLLFNVYFDIQNSIQILVGLKLGFSKVSKSHCNQLIKSSYIWWLQQWYSHLHTCSGDENQNLPLICLPVLTQNPLRVLGLIIYCWNRIFKEITMLLHCKK